MSHAGQVAEIGRRRRRRRPRSPQRRRPDQSRQNRPSTWKQPYVWGVTSSGSVVVRESVGSRWRGFIGHGVGVAAVAASILGLTPLAAGVSGLALSVALAVGALLMLVLGLTWPHAVVMRIRPPTVRVWSGIRRGEAIPLASIVSVSSMWLPSQTAGVPQGADVSSPSA